MTAEAKTTNIMLRNDTILGVCEAIGQDFGINPTWLRVAFCVPIFWSPTIVLGAYFALGLVVAVTRFAAPDRRVQVPAAPSLLVEVETDAADIVAERELMAA